MKVAFVYPNPRGEMLRDVDAGRAPDTGLLGQNHLGEHGIRAVVHEPLLRRTRHVAGLRHRVTWIARELTLPWELGDAELAVTPLGNVFPVVARFRRRPKVVLIGYHLAATYARSSPARRRLLRASFRSAAGIVCVSAAGRARLLSQAGLEPERVHVILQGVDERFWSPTPLPTEGPVLTVGRDLARDYATFATAVAGLPTRAIVVAKSENLEGLQLPANVETLLDIRPLEIRELYAQAACVVVPIRRDDHRLGSENSGTTALLEAMACGRPVVVSERAPLADYIRPGETALTVPPEDPAALRAAIERVLADPELARSLGEAGRKLVEAKCTTRAFAAGLADIVRSAK